MCEIVSVVTQACKADTQDNVKGILCSVASFQEVVVGFVTNSTFGIDQKHENFNEEDEERYTFGNYFKTEEEAQEYADYMKKRSLEWHEKRDDNE